MIGRVSFVTQWLDFGSLKLRLWFGKSMLWINISRTNNLILLKLIGTENTVKIAPFVFVLFFLEGNQMFGRRKMKRMTLKKSLICSGQAYLSHGSIFGHSNPLYVWEKHTFFWCSIAFYVANFPVQHSYSLFLLVDFVIQLTHHWDDGIEFISQFTVSERRGPRMSLLSLVMICCLGN